LVRLRQSSKHITLQQTDENNTQQKHPAFLELIRSGKLLKLLLHAFQHLQTQIQ
jgi:hypothetical protein